MQPHYIVVCVGTKGDIHPFMRIAQTLQAMGKQVTFITNTYHAALLHGSGLRFVGLGTHEEYERFLQNPDIWDPKKGFSALLADYQTQLLQLVEALRDTAAHGPAVAISHPIAVPGVAMARARGFMGRIASLYLAPSTIRTCHDPVRIGEATLPRWMPMSWRRAMWRFVEKGWIDPVALAQTNGARRTLGLPDVQSTFLAHIEQAPDLTVALFPSWFGPTMPDWPQPLLRGDFQLFDAEAADCFSPELSAFLAAGDKPLVFTPGTGHLHADGFFAAALKATALLGRRAIFLTPHHAQVPAALPPTVLWQRYVPLSGLLPKVKALVHHGGIGTTAEALRAATPQLVTPFAWDQFDNGARIAAMGVGQVLPAKKVTARRLVRALGPLTSSDDVQARCQEVATRFSARPDASDLCAAMAQRLSGPD